jgi:hypothetical protein
MPSLSKWVVYLWIVLGVFVSLIMPVIKQLATPPQGGKGGLTGFFARIWPIARPYVFMGIYSLLSALIILAGLSAAKLPMVNTFGSAFLLGYFCDATLQKLKT